MKSNIQVIDQIVGLCKPYLDELGAKYRVKLIDDLNKKEEKYTEDYIQLRVDYYKQGMVIDLLKALFRYLKQGDEIMKGSIVIKTKPVIKIDATIIRDGNKYWFETDLIPAGGYNIQTFHYRYIVKTNLPKDENQHKDLLKGLNKKAKLEHEIKLTKFKLVDAEKKLIDFKEMSDEEHFKVFHKRSKVPDFYYDETNEAFGKHKTTKAMRIKIAEHNIESIKKSLDKLIKKLNSIDYEK